MCCLFSNNCYMINICAPRCATLSLEYNIYLDADKTPLTSARSAHHEAAALFSLCCEFALGRIIIFQLREREICCARRAEDKRGSFEATLMNILTRRQERGSIRIEKRVITPHQDSFPQLHHHKLQIRSRTRTHPGKHWNRP
jgi:hypothetical protein